MGISCGELGLRKRNPNAIDVSNPIALIGQTNFRNKKVRFGIKQRDRLFHMLLIGKTGSGKSTVLAQMMRSDLENGVRFALLDAHGDLADQVLGSVPENRIPDVIYINPTREEFSPAINLLEGKHKHLAVSQFLSIFHHLWPEFWGPRMEYLLRNTLLLLAETFPNASLADIPRVLADLFLPGAAGESPSIWGVENFLASRVCPVLKDFSQ